MCPQVRRVDLYSLVKQQRVGWKVTTGRKGRSGGIKGQCLQLFQVVYPVEF